MNRLSPLSLWRYRLLIVVLLCLTAGAAFAQTSYDRAVDAYRSKQYSTALREFQQAATENPRDAKAYFGIGTAQIRLKNYPEAVRAWERAQQLDPNLGFTRNPSNFRRDLAKAQRLAQGQGASSIPRERSVASTSARDAQRPWVDRIMSDLQASSAFVDSSLASQVSEPELESVAKKYGSKVKVAVLEKVPAGLDRDPRNDRNEFAKDAYRYLNLRNGLMIVVEPKGIGAYTDGMSWGKFEPIIQQSRASFSAADKIQVGVDTLAGRTFGAMQARQRSAQTFWFVLILAIVGAVVFFRSRAKAKEKQQVTELNRGIGERMAALQDEFKRFDLEAAAATDTPLLQEAKQLRSAAVDPFALAGEKFNHAVTLQQFREADEVTTQAEKLAARARVRLEQALGRRTLDDPNEGGSIPRAEDVPEGDRGACFFCSKPNRLADLQPLQINVEGEARRVLACEDCYDIAKTGRQPQVLTVPDDDGRRVPWYQSNRYDPWNDYGRGGVFGGGGFGLMDYLLLSNLFSHSYGHNTTVIMPQDTGYSSGAANDSAGDFFGGGEGAANDSVGDFMGGLFGSSSDSDGGGGDDFFSGGGGDDFFGGGGGDDFFGGSD